MVANMEKLTPVFCFIADSQYDINLMTSETSNTENYHRMDGCMLPSSGIAMNIHVSRPISFA